MFVKLTLAVAVTLISTVTLAETSFRRVPDSQSPPVFSYSSSPDPPVLPVVTRWQQKSRNSDEVVYSIDREFSSSQATTVALSTAAPQHHQLVTTSELPPQSGQAQLTDVAMEDEISIETPSDELLIDEHQMIADDWFITSPDIQHSTNEQQDERRTTTPTTTTTSTTTTTKSPVSNNDEIVQTVGTIKMTTEIPLAAVDESTEYIDSQPNIDIKERVPDEQSASPSSEKTVKKATDRVGISVDVYYTGSGNSDDSYLIDVERHGEVEVNSSSTKFDQYTVVKRPYTAAVERRSGSDQSTRDDSIDNLTRHKLTTNQNELRYLDERQQFPVLAPAPTVHDSSKTTIDIVESGTTPAVIPADISNITKPVDKLESESSSTTMTMTTTSVLSVTSPTTEKSSLAMSSQLADNVVDIDESIIIGTPLKTADDNQNRASLPTSALGRDHQTSSELVDSLPVHEHLSKQPLYQRPGPRHRYYPTRSQQLHTVPMKSTSGKVGPRYGSPIWRPSLNVRTTPWIDMSTRPRLGGFQPNGLVLERISTWPTKRAKITLGTSNEIREPSEDKTRFEQQTVWSRTRDDIGKRSDPIDGIISQLSTKMAGEALDHEESVHQPSFSSMDATFDSDPTTKPPPQPVDDVLETGMQLESVTLFNVSDWWTTSGEEYPFYNSSAENVTSDAVNQTWLAGLFDVTPPETLVASTLNDTNEQVSSVSASNRTVVLHDHQSLTNETGSALLGAHRGIFPGNIYRVHQNDGSGRSVLPALVGVLEALTRKQFSWVDLMLAISCTVAVLLACINLAMFIVHVTRGKRGKLTFPHASTTSMASPPVPPPPPPPSSSKDTQSNASRGSSSGYADHMSSASSHLGSSSPGSNPSPPPMTDPPAPIVIPLPPPAVSSQSSFSPSTTALDRRRLFGSSDRKEPDFDETLCIRSLTFKRPLTDWGFTSGVGVAMTTPDDREPSAVMTKDSIRSKKGREVSLISTVSDQDGGVDMGEKIYGDLDEHFNEHLHHQRYQTARMNVAATLRNNNQLGLQHAPTHQQMTGSSTIAVPRYRASGTSGGTLFNNYIYSGIGGLVIDVDDKDLDCTTNSDFVYGKNYVELDPNAQMNGSNTDIRQIDVNRKRRERRSSKVGHVKRRGNGVPSVNGGNSSAFYRPFKKLFSGASKSGSKTSREEQFVKQIL